MARKLKPLHPEGCARNLPEALRLLKMYTAGSFDVFALSESIHAARRADIMRGYCGKDVAFGLCTSGAMLDTLSEHANDHGANPPVDSNSQLIAWLKAMDSKAPGKPDNDSAQQQVTDMMAAANAADDQGLEAAETPNLSASSGVTAMSTAVAKKPKGGKKKPAKKAGKAKANGAKKAAVKKAAAPKEPKAAKPAKEPKAKKEKVAKEAKPKKAFLLDVAADVVAKASEPLNVKQIIEKIVADALYEFGKGKTPDRTLNSSIIREIAKEGSKARFKKTGRGLYVGR
jgi:hypothetical protein